MVIIFLVTKLKYWVDWWYVFHIAGSLSEQRLRWKIPSSVGFLVYGLITQLDVKIKGWSQHSTSNFERAFACTQYMQVRFVLIIKSRGSHVDSQYLIIGIKWAYMLQMRMRIIAEIRRCTFVDNSFSNESFGPISSIIAVKLWRRKKGQRCQTLFRYINIARIGSQNHLNRWI